MGDQPSKKLREGFKNNQSVNGETYTILICPEYLVFFHEDQYFIVPKIITITLGVVFFIT